MRRGYKIFKPGKHDIYDPNMISISIDFFLIRFINNKEVHSFCMLLLMFVSAVPLKYVIFFFIIEKMFYISVFFFTEFRI